MGPRVSQGAVSGWGSHQPQVTYADDITWLRLCGFCLGVAEAVAQTLLQPRILGLNLKRVPAKNSLEMIVETTIPPEAYENTLLSGSTFTY